MLRYVFIIVIIVSKSLLAESPIKNGMINFSGNLSYMNEKTEDPDNYRHHLILNPQFGYFVLNNLSINLSADYSYESFLDYSITEYGIGPALRYYINFDKVNPFVSVGYLFTEKIDLYESRREFDFPGQSMTISTGIDYFVTNSVALETIVRYRIITKEEPAYTISADSPYHEVFSSRNYNSFLIGFGINVFL